MFLVIDFQPSYNTVCHRSPGRSPALLARSVLPAKRTRRHRIGRQLPSVDEEVSEMPGRPDKVFVSC